MDSESDTRNFAPPASNHVCSREYFPFADDHLPRRQSMIARLTASGCSVVMLPALTAIPESVNTRSRWGDYL
jgi:hypothetical protein